MSLHICFSIKISSFAILCYVKLHLLVSCLYWVRLHMFGKRVTCIITIIAYSVFKEMKMMGMKIITIKIISIDKDKITGLEIGDDESYDKNKIIDIEMNKNIYLALLVEMKRANTIVDEDFQCFNDRIFTISEREWFRAPKKLWDGENPPKAFGVTLRTDLEKIYAKNS